MQDYQRVKAKVPVTGFEEKRPNITPRIISHDRIQTSFNDEGLNHYQRPFLKGFDDEE